MFDIEKAMKLYHVWKSKQWPKKPKQTIFFWKCPDCNRKLKKTSYKIPVYTKSEKTDFFFNLAREYGLEPGFYQFTLDHFVCSCGYEYIQNTLSELEF